MSDDVSKKDLQALESRLTRQISDLSKQVAELKSGFNKDLDEQDKTTVTVRKELDKRVDDVDKRIDGLDTGAKALQDGINTLARAHSDLAKRVDKLS